jgi:AcrR family transcriptional regulator
MKRTSKEEWLRVALDTLDEEGVEALRVERIAKKLGVSRSSFYWYFKDRNDLRDQLIDLWEYESTSIGTSNPRLRNLSPKGCLEEMMQVILEKDLGRYDSAMIHWAKVDAKIATRVAKVYKLRLKFIEEMFSQLGFEGVDLEMRTRLFVCYHSSERSMFWKESKKSLRELIQKRVDLLTQH